ncbi:hypothetical protein OIU79_026577 [Salix purpurea]|uniref:Uncharacterized protein n=1 Tax=Salix purpurea TaxID=77065 RepID=A0A9Q1A0K2_SALPP|nr:hypothetical protein OIU79_026577 [Salix purpurea]
MKVRDGSEQVSFSGIHIFIIIIKYLFEEDDIEMTLKFNTRSQQRHHSRCQVDDSRLRTAPRSHLQLFLESKHVQDPIKNFLTHTETKNSIHALPPCL